MNHPVIAIIIVAAVMAGCSMDRSFQDKHVSGVKSSNTIDPGVPALVIVAKKMTQSEKLAYDNASGSKSAHHKSEHLVAGN